MFPHISIRYYRSTFFEFGLKRTLKIKRTANTFKDNYGRIRAGNDVTYCIMIKIFDQNGKTGLGWCYVTPSHDTSNIPTEKLFR